MKSADSTVEIFGPKGVRKLVETAIELTQTFLKYELKFIELESATSIDLGIRDHFWHISAHPLKHRVPCYGYVVNEVNLLGKFDGNKALSMGVPKHLISKLSKSTEITLDSGAIITKLQCLFPPPKGRKLVILGDTNNSDSILEAGNECDVLIHETTFDKTKVDTAQISGHSTTIMAAEFAKKNQN